MCRTCLPSGLFSCSQPNLYSTKRFFKYDSTSSALLKFIIYIWFDKSISRKIIRTIMCLFTLVYGAAIWLARINQCVQNRDRIQFQTSFSQNEMKIYESRSIFHTRTMGFLIFVGVKTTQVATSTMIRRIRSSASLLPSLDVPQPFERQSTLICDNADRVRVVQISVRSFFLQI